MQIRSLDEIYQWAKSKESDGIVGLAGVMSGCPLATCHNELDGEERSWEFGYCWATCDGDRVNPSSYPAYVGSIMDKVDEFPYEAPITASEFLAIVGFAQAS